MRRPLIAGNWKMNHDLRSSREFVDSLCSIVALDEGPLPVDVAIFPPSVYVQAMVSRLEGKPLQVGGQDVHPEQRGAHTGDLSAHQLLDVGCELVLCGHSERRQDHGETNGWIAKKRAASIAAGLDPVLCVGETLEQREAQRTQEVLTEQLDAGLAEFDPSATLGRLVAYEPVWAIGTGRTATPEIAQRAHAVLRERWASHGGEELRLLYGGSVKPTNCEELLRQPDVDGFLIGGASLDPAEFADIIQRCAALVS